MTPPFEILAARHAGVLLPAAKLTAFLLLGVLNEFRNLFEARDPELLDTIAHIRAIVAEFGGPEKKRKNA